MTKTGTWPKLADNEYPSTIKTGKKYLPLISNLAACSSWNRLSPLTSGNKASSFVKTSSSRRVVFPAAGDLFIVSTRIVPATAVEKKKFLQIWQGFPCFSPILDTTGCKTTSCRTSILTWYCAKRFDINFWDSSRAKQFLLENIVILALIWWNNTYSNLNAVVAGRVCKKKNLIMVVRCEMKIPSLRKTVRHHSTSFVTPNSYPHDGIFNPHLTTIILIISPEN